MISGSEIPDFSELASTSGVDRDLLESPIDVLALRARIRDCFEYSNIGYIGDLVQKTKHELLRIPNFGRRSLNDVEYALAEKSLFLSAGIEAITPQKDTPNSTEINKAIRNEEALISHAHHRKERLEWLRDKSPDLKRNILTLFEQAGVQTNRPQLKAEVNKLITTAALHIRAKQLIP